MGNIFLSYRHEDTMVISQQIYQKLCERFGTNAVYKDVHSIPQGVNYLTHIDANITESPVFLELIGPGWSGERDEQNKSRLYDTQDVLRIEIKTALKLRIPIIPVFIDTPVPDEKLLPRDVRPLLKFNGIFLDSHNFAAGMSKLISAIEPYVRESGYQYRVLAGVQVLVPPLDSIPAGSFTMGSDANESEKPAHDVALADFKLARYPVTVEEYALFLAATGHQEPAANGGVYWATQHRSDHVNHPVVNVSWQDAVEYARWLAQITGQSWRLPSEAEWEKAARGPQSFMYTWGNDGDATKANTVENGIHTTTKVKTYAHWKSPYGTIDMLGNAWEWTASLSRPYSEKAHTRSDDLQTPGQRIRRGGSWQENMTFARTTKRNADDPAICKPTIGFRLALG